MTRSIARNWDDVVSILQDEPAGSVIRLRKGLLPHPRTHGLARSAGLPLGQVADYRLELIDGSGLHVRDFGRHYEAHIDQAHPGGVEAEHPRRDAPAAFVAGGVALGATIGGALGNKNCY